MDHVTSVNARIDHFYACFFCGKNNAAEYAAICHNGKKEDNNAKNI